MHLRLSPRALCCCSVVALACDAAPLEETKAETTATLPVLTAPPAATTEPKQVNVNRPHNRAELILNATRRAKLEAAFPEAKGFADLLDLEQGLFKKNLTRGKAEAAIRAFDRLAKTHWVLFVGNIGKQEGGSFELPVRYTARDPKDPFGLTSNWFPIQFDGVKGYDAADYEPGQLIAVLAEYRGGQKVTRGYDVVMLEKWDFDSVE